MKCNFKVLITVFACVSEHAGFVFGRGMDEGQRALIALARLT